MYQKVLTLVLSLTSFTLGCSDDGAQVKNTADVAADFSDPPGTLFDGALDQAVNDALAQGGAQDITQAVSGLFPGSPALTARTRQSEDKPFEILDNISDAAALDCIDGEADRASADLACIAAGVDGCTGGGTLSFSGNGGETSAGFEIAFNGASLSCGTEKSLDCDGSANFGFERIGLNDIRFITCADLTCAISASGMTFVESANGCSIADLSGSLLILVGVGGRNVLCLGVLASEDCSTVCTEWEDREGPATITCDVTETLLGDGTCDSSGDDIVSVENCVIDRTRSSCFAQLVP